MIFAFSHQAGYLKVLNVEVVYSLVANKPISPIMSQKGTRVCFKADEEVMQRFKELVLRTYGKLHGPLQEEFNEALRLHSDRLEARVTRPPPGVTAQESFRPPKSARTNPPQGGSILQPIAGRWKDS